MIKKLVKMGNSWGIVIPVNNLELIGINPKENPEIEYNFDGKSIIITPIKNK